MAITDYKLGFIYLALHITYIRCTVLEDEDDWLLLKSQWTEPPQLPLWVVGPQEGEPRYLIWTKLG